MGLLDHNEELSYYSAGWKPSAGFKQAVTRSDLHFKIISLAAVWKVDCRGQMETGKPLRASLVDNGLDQSADGRTDGLLMDWI